MSDIASYIRENAVFLIIIMLFAGVWYLERIAKTVEAIRAMLFYEIHKQ
jgi:hypothetical protein